MNRWIKLWSKITEWEWYSNGNTFRVFLHLLLNANYQDREWHGTTIKRGEVVTSVRSLSRELKLSIQQTRTALSNLQKTREITIVPTSKWSRIIVENYERYQCSPEATNTQGNTQTNTQPNNQSTHNSTTPIEERSIEEKNITIVGQEYPVKSVVDHLNDKAGTRYKYGSNKTKTHIQARFKEGYTLDDFYKVIDKKCAEWKGTEWEKFLRPETLFGGKFENYLNQPEKKQTTGNPFLDLLKEQEA